MHKRKKNIISVSTFLILFIFLILYITTVKNRITVYQNVIAEKGIFDFSDFDFEQFQLSGLTGDVELYWNQLLDPTNFNSNQTIQPDGYLHIPGTWNNFEVAGKKVGSYGFATIHFKIQLSEDDLYSLKMKGFDNAYKLWVNGKLLTETGRVGRTKKTMQPSWKRKIVSFKSNNKIADIVIQISNFQHRKGGPESIIVFGKTMAVFSYKSILLSIDLFILGILFILCSYHLVLYFFRQKDLVHLYFTIICFLIMLRLISTGEKIILDIYPHIHWLLAVRIEYLSYTIIVPFFFLLLNQFYKDEFSFSVIKWISYIAAAFSLVILLFPPIIFSYTPIAYQFFIAFVWIYGILSLIKAIRLKRENSVIFLFTYLVFGLVIINDILFYNNLIETGYLLSYGIFVLAYAQSIILSKNVSMAFVNSENLSKELNQVNLQLERKIQERTEQIKLQKDELEHQATMLQNTNEQLKELNAFKENLTDMIIHDLKSPLNIVLNFSKDDRVVFAGNQMLNLVHNLLDVQRYENSVMKLNLETVSVHDLIQKAVFQMNFLIKEKNIQLSVKKSKDYFVSVDQEIIHRVFINLLSNALKFTPSKGIITIFLKEKLNAVEICFSDSGPGIPKDQKNVIFEKFGQFIVQRAGRTGSTGLGLTFCKMAVEAHNGKIDFTSVLGKGTTFCVTLPKEGVVSEYEKVPVNTASKPLNLNEINFSKEERSLMAGILHELSNSKIYEIGKIKRLIKKIDPVKTDHLKLWITELQKAMLNSDNELFLALIEKIK